MVEIPELAVSIAVSAEYEVFPVPAVPPHVKVCSPVIPEMPHVVEYVVPPEVLNAIARVFRCMYQY